MLLSYHFSSFYYQRLTQLDIEYCIKTVMVSGDTLALTLHSLLI